MKSLVIGCECKCGSQLFYLRLKREEQVGLLTCDAGHHSLLLDSRDYWADVLPDGRPKQSRCRCGGTLFRVALKYEFRDDGEVRTVLIKPSCSYCGREPSSVCVEIKYAPTSDLVSKPLDPIDRPWFQPKRQQVTSFWLPADAERFATYLVSSLGARVFAEDGIHDYRESRLENIEFHPELRRDLLFTNLHSAEPMSQREPENAGPFIRLTTPLHMHYGVPANMSDLDNDVCLLHYIRYSEQVVHGTDLEAQPLSFLKFATDAREWLKTNFVSLRGKNTADNLQEHLRVKQLRS